MSRRDGALISGTATTILATFLGISLILTMFVLATGGQQVQDQLDIPEDFELLSDRTVRQAVDLQVQENRVAGSVAQMLYAIQVDRGNGEQVELMEAVRLHTYCQGKRSIQMCSSYPDRDTLRSAIASGLDDIFAVESPGSRPYRFVMSYRNQPLITIGSASGTTSVEFVAPMPGAQHARVALQVDSGRFSTGVTTG